MTVELNLTVNDVVIQTDYFVERFVDHTVSGMIESLEGTGQIQDLKLSLDGDDIEISLNGAPVPTNFFVNKIFKSTLLGMVSVLKGFTPGNKLYLTIRK